MAKKKDKEKRQPLPPFVPPALGRHRHKCPKCGTVWEHDDSCGDAPCDVHDAAHTCPNPGCGSFQTFRYGLYEDEEEMPTHQDHHEKKEGSK